MLSPGHYGHDLSQSILNRIIDHQPKDLLCEDAKHKRMRSRIKWEELYPEVPFDLDLNTICEENFSSSFSYDIITASSRQQSFFYQVCCSKEYCFEWCCPMYKRSCWVHKEGQNNAFGKKLTPRLLVTIPKCYFSGNSEHISFVGPISNKCKM